MNALTHLTRLRCPGGAPWVAHARVVPEEAAVAFHYNGRSHAVMMATPSDLEDFAVGFSLAESVVQSPQQILDLRVHEAGEGAIEIHMTTSTPSSPQNAPAPRLTAPSGCGLCGVSCSKNALRPVHLVRRPRPALWNAATIATAMRALQGSQHLNQEARALHAAGLWAPGQGLVAVREDIGRHCALDKLAGALARKNVSAAGAAVLLTSRVSLELVQKTARMGACLLIAVSAPTALAVRTAHEAGITLVAVVRGEDFEVFTHPDRIVDAQRWEPAGHGEASMPTPQAA